MHFPGTVSFYSRIKIKQRSNVSFNQSFIFVNFKLQALWPPFLRLLKFNVAHVRTESGKKAFSFLF